VDDEAIEVLELPFSQALQMVADGEIRDGKAVILLQYLQTSGLMSGNSDKSD
ncbi:GDP-mannose pyrophosphatase NudK, partial [Escherichia coli]|nr:GDP-mannose pyrophosphatase NudK [Klebsiella pneumoniae]NEN68008.1 GDP-mannose pyrophosphatase NudK [Escherichia coli]